MRADDGDAMTANSILFGIYIILGNGPIFALEKGVLQLVDGIMVFPKSLCQVGNGKATVYPIANGKNEKDKLWKKGLN